MVRFIIRNGFNPTAADFYIYIPIWLDLLFSLKLSILTRYNYLHSNMVRFIIKGLRDIDIAEKQFTFQYG